MGDALAVVLINKRDFNSSDFRRFHPGGTLGQRLCSRVCDIMLTGDMVPRVYEKAGLEAAVGEIDRLSFGAAFVLDEADVLVGIITDGDLRRVIAGKQSIEALSVAEIMTPHPRRVGPLTPAYDALNLMERYQITVLPIADEKGRVLGLLHLHDILGKGEFRFNGT
jgi:arabinose-5-phosphate isomerase